MRASLASLRCALLVLRPAGPDGFEGLVATAMSDLTGLTFRLAKSGSQFGRDAATPRARFAAALEAKRYNAELTLEDLLGKAELASTELRGDVDVWALCATSEVGEGTQRKLDAKLEQDGITLVTLDWSHSTQPRLAVLLCAARERCLAWCEANSAVELAAALEEAATALGQEAGFSVECSRLLSELRADSIGIAALVKVNESWSEEAFSGKTQSQRALGQYVDVQGPGIVVLERPELERNLAALMSYPAPEGRCIAVLGREGTGKTWLVARTWLTLPDRPVALFATHKHVHLLLSDNPAEVLARLASNQSAGNPSTDFDRWRRRFERWARVETNAGRNRFVVVLDGLNETMGTRWATIIQQLAGSLSELGGFLVVTSREVFWRERVRSRLLGPGVLVEEFSVPEYTPAEVGLLVRKAGHDPESVTGEMRAFLRNPRVCSLAMTLLDRLRATPAELTVERVLLEYWRGRLEERGDAVVHDAHEFENLLRSHARDFRERAGATFDRNRWSDHCGLTRRGDGRDAAADLADIEEGAFMRVSDADSDRYEFKPDVVPFALGLLLTHEVAKALQDRNASVSDLLDPILEAMGGFDQVAEVLRAATGIAFFSQSYPDAVRSGLAVAWLRAQNKSLFNEADLAPLLLVSPEAIFDTYEAVFRDGGDSGIQVLNSILRARDHVRVAAAVHSRVERWLRLWSKAGPVLSLGHPDRQGYLERWEKRLVRTMAGLSDDERAFLERECIETDDARLIDLVGSAALLLASGTQEWAAASLLAWNFSLAVTGDARDARADVDWAIRTNNVDFEATRRAVTTSASGFQALALTDAGRRAAFGLLRSLGSLDGDEAAAGIWQPPPSKDESWRLVEDYCDTDPYDPTASEGNIARARSAVASLNALRIWSYMGRSDDDHELEFSRAALARFAPGPLIDAMIAVAATAAVRDGQSLTHMVGPLRMLSPLFDESSVEAVEVALRRVLDGSAVIAAELKPSVAACLHWTLVPHIDGRKQLELLVALPPEVADTVELQAGYKPMETDEAWQALEAAISDGTPPSIARTLHFLGASAAAFDDRCRNAVSAFLRHPSARVAAGAATLAIKTGDRPLCAEVLEAAASGWPQCSETVKDLLDVATARAVIAIREVSSLGVVRPRLLGLVAKELGGTATDLLEDATAEVAERLLGAIQTQRLDSVDLSLHIGLPGELPNLSFTFSDEGDTETEGGRVVRRRPGSAVNRAVRSKARVAEVRAYLDALRGESALNVAEEPDLGGLKLLAADRPEACIEWARRIIAEPDIARIAAIKNFALALALAMAKNEPKLAVALIERVHGTREHVRIMLSPDGPTLRTAALFAPSKSPCFGNARSRSFAAAANDAALQELAVAADLYGHEDWLTSWIAGQVASRVPGEVARGLTVAGLRMRQCGPGDLLDEDWGDGFLAEVAKSALECRRRYDWARHWMAECLSAEEPANFWRYGELARGIADIRSIVESPAADIPLAAFIPYLLPAVRHEVGLRTSKRKRTLFGMSPPSWVH